MFRLQGKLELSVKTKEVVDTTNKSCSSKMKNIDCDDDEDIDRGVCCVQWVEILLDVKRCNGDALIWSLWSWFSRWISTTPSFPRCNWPPLCEDHVLVSMSFFCAS
mmetsp:Transcript_14360/g.21496  ORF Transcript_14360/g.21496 Transcript_14360/m.21496 type:complete len:106 (+) Transcript_14360:1388-1705(+)